MLPNPDQEHDGSAVDGLLAAVRAGVERVTADRLPAEAAAGALVVDIRPVEQRARDGELPGALVVDRNVLEWRLDPTCPHRLPEADDPERRVVLVCNEGYSSSLAAATLRRLGLSRATDLVGGYQAVLALSRRCPVAPGTEERGRPPLV
ncbi:MAG TPA: rhodanese-like domain-containing protein [Marmoricola sp.]|nr:rhodanese-like domain-containing protein [Marmoricola sp.]